MKSYDKYLECNKCGRRWPKANPKPCPCACPTGTAEYRHKVAGCIRNKNPECPYNAVIPSVVVENIDGIQSLRDCFVHVASINTTFYIDDKGRLMITWAGPVEVEGYDVETNPLNLRSQMLFSSTEEKDMIVYFDKTGAGHVMFEKEN